MPRSAIPLLLSLVALADQARPQERVGALGASSRIDFEGVTAFDPETIVGGVFGAHDTLERVDPSAPRAPFLEWVRERVTTGYRFAGFADVRVEVDANDDESRLRVRVDEGARSIAATPRVVMAPADPEVVAAVAQALGREDAELGAIWRAGGPARFGDAASDAIRAAVLAACRDHAAFSATVELCRVELGDGTVELEVTLLDAQPRSIASIRFDGIDTLEAEHLRNRIGFRPGTIASADELAALERAVTAVGRYRDVIVDPPRHGAGPIDPLVVRLTPIDRAPDWDEMPWQEMDLIRRAVSALGPRFADGAHLHLSGQPGEAGPLGEQTAPERIEFRVSMSGVQLVVPDVRISGAALGDLRAHVDGALGLRVGTSTLGELLRIPLPDVGPRAGAVLFVRAAPNPPPATDNSMSYGVGFVADVASRLRGMPEDAAVSFGPNAAFVFDLHGASLLSMIQQHRARDREGPGQLVIGFESAAIRIDRDTAHASISVGDDDLRAEIVDEPIPPIEIGPAAPDLAARLMEELAPDPATDVRDAVQLAARALRPLAHVEIWKARNADPKPLSFHVPDRREPNGIKIVSAWLQDQGRRIADGFPAASWPHVFARDLPWMVIDPRRTWPRFSEELQRLRQADACGPIGWGLAALVMDVLGADELGRDLAAEAERECTFDGLWRDVEALGAEGSWTGGVLRALGANWRADTAALSPDTRAAFESAADDLAAVRVGLRVLWDAGLGDALRGELRR